MGIEGPVDYALTAEAQSQRGYDSIPQREATIYRDVPQGFRDRIITLNLGYTPIEGTRLSLFLRAQTAYFGYDTLGSPTFDDANSNGHTTTLLGRVGGATHLFGDRLESGLYVGQLQDDRRYLEPLAAADPNMTSSDSRYHSYRTDVQWNNTLRLDDLLAAPGTVRQRDDVRLRVHRRPGQGAKQRGIWRVPLQPVRLGIDDDERAVRGRADNGAATPGEDRPAQGRTGSRTTRRRRGGLAASTT